MKRRLDWPEQMAAALEAAQIHAYTPEYYCAEFAADVVLAMTDEDPLAEYRGLDVAGAYRKMLDAGYGNLNEQLAAKFKAMPIAFAQRGDVVLKREEGDEVGAVGICCGVDSAFIAEDGGLTFRPTLSMAAAYSVGS